MADDAGYKGVLAIEAAAFLTALPRRKQRHVLNLADQIAQHPFRAPLSKTLDAEGRSVLNLLLHQYLFSYWIDHASREIRITQIIAV